MKFERGKNIIRQIRVGNTIKEEVENFAFNINGESHRFRLSINDPFKDMTRDQLLDPDQTFWVNPKHQDCLNYGAYTAEQLRSFMRGDLTCKIIKGKNKTQRQKYLHYLRFQSTDKDHIAWSIKYYFKWFDKLETDYNPHNHYSMGMINTKIKKKLVLGATRKNSEEENIRQERVILSMFAPYAGYIKSELEYRKYQDIKRECDKEFYGIKRTLYCLGVGYMGACNTPEEFLNLNWINDIIYSKGYYLFLKEKEERGEIELPDFAWLSSRAFHGNGEESKEETEF
jgi:hypothetical protein